MVAIYLPGIKLIHKKIINECSFFYICNSMRVKDENKKECLRLKTIEIVVKEGFDGLSMPKLAKAAGVSPATIYIHFKDREDLVKSISIDISTKMFEHSLKGFDPDMPFAEGLKIQWKNRAAFFLKYPIEMQFIEQVRYSPVYDKVKEELANRFSEVMGKFVNNAIRRKELVKLPFEVYWSIAFAPLYQLIKFHMQGKSYANKEFSINNKIMNQALELVLKALKP